MTIHRTLLASLLYLLSTTTVYADIYSCRDSAGELITSDRPIRECEKASAQKVYQDNGTLKSEIPTAPTAEQRHATELQQQQQELDSAHKAELQREQRYLTTHYPSESAIEDARKKAIDAVETKIARETHSLEVTNEAIKKNQNAMALVPKDQPGKLRELQLKASDLTQSVTESNRLIANFQNEEVGINHQFDATHKRYAEIVVSGPH